MSHPLPQVHYGKVTNEKLPKGKVDEHDDDKELEKTPKSVVKLLGFDPKTFTTKVSSAVLRVFKTKSVKA